MNEEMIFGKMKREGEKKIHISGGGKTGILTFHETANFGACLQAVATYKILAEMGYKCEIINYHCDEIDRREIVPGEWKEHSLFYPIRLFMKNRKVLKKHSELMKFLRKETIVNGKKYRKNTVTNINEEYDLFLIGSDMLWCTQFTNHDYTFMLDFVLDDRKKYSYATSIGYFWEKKEEKIIKEYLKKFQSISVREDDMKIYLEGILEKKIETVCDPTMLIKPESWLEYAQKSSVSFKKDYCLVYVDVPEKTCLEAAKAYARLHNMDVFLIGFHKLGRYTKGYKIIEVYKINDFLAMIANAKMLFTASYHGMLFSIYFHTSFIYYNKDSSRLESIAKRFELERRNGDKWNVEEMDSIDWCKVDELRETFRKHSHRILSKMMEGSVLKQTDEIKE